MSIKRYAIFVILMLLFLAACTSAVERSTGSQKINTFTTNGHTVTVQNLPDGRLQIAIDFPYDLEGTFGAMVDEARFPCEIDPVDNHKLTCTGPGFPAGTKVELRVFYQNKRPIFVTEIIIPSDGAYPPPGTTGTPWVYPPPPDTSTPTRTLPAYPPPTSTGTRVSYPPPLPTSTPTATNTQVVYPPPNTSTPSTPYPPPAPTQTPTATNTHVVYPPPPTSTRRPPYPPPPTNTPTNTSAPYP